MGSAQNPHVLRVRSGFSALSVAKLPATITPTGIDSKLIRLFGIAEQPPENDPCTLMTAVKFMKANCLNIKRVCIRIFLLILLWWLDCQRFITASLLIFSKIYFLRCSGVM
ncbi:hypothetical protein FGT88_05635 [Salmonella enterica]|nr:hypothetical protein [Salmonella enterica]